VIRRAIGKRWTDRRVELRRRQRADQRRVHQQHRSRSREPVIDSSVDPNVLNFLTIPNALTSLPPSLKLAGNNAIYAFDPNFRNPRSGQVSIAVEQQIDRNTTVEQGGSRARERSSSLPIHVGPGGHSGCIPLLTRGLCNSMI
jgi:hypothetical protein